jgi:dextranase
MKFFLILLSFVSLLTACKKTTIPSEYEPMENQINITSIKFKKSFFLPTETVDWIVNLKSDLQQSVNLISTVSYLDQTMSIQRQNLQLEAGSSEFIFSWDPPLSAPKGYGLDIRVENERGDILAVASSAFDVLEKWTQNPRYGFLVDFSPGRNDGEQTLDQLLPFRINALQFYDWMYRHDIYLPPEDSFIDPLGRQLSLGTTRALIEAAHQRNMAAMPYTAVYAASIPFYKQHPDWALLEPDGKPSFFGENFLVIMDPRPGSQWTNHLFAEFKKILKETKFDGIHLDQYGAPKVGYDRGGNQYDLDRPLAELIDATAEIVDQERGEKGSVVFNAVTNWPIETVAPSNQDLVYIEVWPPYTFFNDIGLLIQQAQILGGGKPVVIAAYIQPAFESNALLNDAIIFANGAGHIEFGEAGGYLADPYFPKYEFPSAKLAVQLEKYYQFSVRYQNWIGPCTQAGQTNLVSIPGVETDAGITKNKVMPVVRESDGFTAISLINLIGLKHGEWKKNLKFTPTFLTDLEVALDSKGKMVDRIWFASPDFSELVLYPLNFKEENQKIVFSIPSLTIWSLAIIEWKK